MFIFIDLCDKGKYSVNGFDIADNGGCTSCSVGFYQDQYGETECKKCPNGLTTVSTGAISLLDCGGELITSQVRGQGKPVQRKKKHDCKKDGLVCI